MAAGHWNADNVHGAQAAPLHQGQPALRQLHRRSWSRCGRDSHAGPTGSSSSDYSALAARWWTWALSQPAPSNPLLDPTGARCANQQSGNTWYLAGTFGSGSVTRSCTVPAHTRLFFPVVNYVDCEFASDAVPVKTVRAFSAFVQTGASNLSVVVDGQAVGPNVIEFEHSDAFSFYLPADNVFGVGPGLLDPCADSGYYALLNSLQPGAHTVAFSGTLTQPAANPGGPPTVTTIDVAYNLTVAG